MKHIRKFETVADFEAAKASLAKPNIGLITETGKSYAISGGSEPEPPIYYPVAMFFENVDTQSVTIGVKKENTNVYPVTLETSTDEMNWELWGSTDTIELTKIVPVGEKLYVRAADNIGYFNDYYKYNYFTSDGKVNVGGNIMSLGYKDFEDKTSITQNYGYAGVFYKMTNLIDASELVLPATTLRSSCYNNMFYGCTSLTTAPEILPATELENNCYSGMFYGCSKLTEAPELPATELKDRCYVTMFQYCTSLTTAPELPATTLAESCYGQMFEGCTSLTTAPELPATTLAKSCYSNMFIGCRKLTEAPELPATTLTENCYYQMFQSCSSLNYIKAMFTTTPSTSYTQAWVYDVASTGTFVKNEAATWDVTGTYGVPTGWTVETATAE